MIKKRDEVDKHYFFGEQDEEEERKYQDPFKDIEDAPWEDEGSNSDTDIILSRNLPHLREILTQIYLKYKNEFKSEVDENSAKFEPLKLEVNERLVYSLLREDIIEEFQSPSIQWNFLNEKN